MGTCSILHYDSVILIMSGYCHVCCLCVGVRPKTVNASFDATKHGGFILCVMHSWEVPRSPKSDNYYDLHRGRHTMNWRDSIKEPMREPEKVVRSSLSLGFLTVLCLLVNHSSQSQGCSHSSSDKKIRGCGLLRFGEWH